MLQQVSRHDTHAQGVKFKSVPTRIQLEIKKLFLEKQINKTLCQQKIF